MQIWEILIKLKNCLKDVNYVDEYGNTSLIFAINGHYEIVKELLKRC